MIVGSNSGVTAYELVSEHPLPFYEIGGRILFPGHMDDNEQYVFMTKDIDTVIDYFKNSNFEHTMPQSGVHDDGLTCMLRRDNVAIEFRSDIDSRVTKLARILALPEYIRFILFHEVYKGMVATKIWESI